MTDSGEIPEDPGEPPLSSGTRLGKYQIARLLGAGGMGAVYEAAHTEIGKRVALKVLASAIAAIPGARARFLREAQLTSKVRHPNIVDITDMGNEGGQAFLVMEFLEGEDLGGRLGHGPPMAVVELVDIMLPVCSALTAAHAAGITHRDLKPQNIFLAAGPHGMQPKVLDFGISKGTDNVTAGTLTGTGAMIGTPYYLAPEQIMDGKSAGPASDQYALGVILYECLTGKRPFESENLFLIFQAIVNGAPQPPRELRPDLDPELERVIARAMSTDPKLRFASVRQLGRMLLPFASERARILWQEAFGPISDAEAAVEASASAAWRASQASSAPSLSAPTSAAAVDTLEVRRKSGGGVTRPMKIALVVAGMAAAGIAGLALLGRSSPQAPPSPSITVAPHALAGPAPAPIAPSPSFKVRVRSEPERAALELDGQPAGTGTLERVFPVDHRRHVLRATATGYEPREVEFLDDPPPERLILVSVPPPAPPSLAPAETVAPGPRRDPTLARPARRPRVEPVELPRRRNSNPNGAPVID